ncbi:MAG: cyclic nucleotide-binding domain-containing protein [Clostridiaceae bacterium]|nr:cyclic nucleotide-binding domain-containing protein [Clostridiaceae bacterium]
MQQIYSLDELNYYIEKFDISDVFEKDMRNFMELHSFQRGEQIYRTSEKTEYLYFLVKGKFKVFTTPKNGKTLLLRFYQPFQVLGDVELICQVNSICNLEVLNEVTCIGIPLEIIRDNCMKDTKFLNYIAQNLAQKLLESSISSSINLIYPLENRLASYILASLQDDENYQGINGIATNKLTDMADFLGTSYRHLNRTLSIFQSKKLIKKHRNFIEIIDRKKLEELAGDLYK